MTRFKFHTQRAKRLAEARMERYLGAALIVQLMRLWCISFIDHVLVVHVKLHHFISKSVPAENIFRLDWICGPVWPRSGGFKDGSRYVSLKQPERRKHENFLRDLAQRQMWKSHIERRFQESIPF